MINKTTRYLSTTVMVLTAAFGSSLLMGMGVAAAATLPARATQNKARTHFSINSVAHPKPAVMGSVTAVNGNSLTVSDKSGTVYTVDVASAKITKGFGSSATTLTVTDIKVNDEVIVTGTVSGSSVTATTVMDGVGRMGRAGGPGNHAPGVVGLVTVVSGNTITVAGKNGTSYTVDASNAKITKGFGSSATTLALSDVQVGDTVGVMGTVSGSAVAATTIVDGIPNDLGGMGRGPGAMMPGIGGTVAAVTGSSFTVTAHGRGTKDDTATTKPAAETFTVNTTSATTYTKDGKAATAADVTVAARVMVEGTVDKTALTVAATKVNIITLKPLANKMPHTKGRMGRTVNASK